MKDYYWNSYDADRNIYSEEQFYANYGETRYYTNRETRQESEWDEELIIFVIVVTTVIIVIMICLIRFYCIARRLTQVEKAQLKMIQANIKELEAQ